MKRLIAAFCALLLLVGCSQASSAPVPVAPSSVAAASSVAASSSDGDLTVDKGLLDVTITIPADFWGDLPDDFDAEAYAKEEGFKKVLVSDDGSMCITMSKGHHNEYLKKMRRDIDDAFDKLIKAEKTPYIMSITASKNLESISMMVDKSEYENYFDLTPYALGFQASIYQTFSGVDLRCDVIVKDFESEEILTSVAFPDDI